MTIHVIPDYPAPSVAAGWPSGEGAASLVLWIAGSSPRRCSYFIAPGSVAKLVTISQGRSRNWGDVVASGHK